MDLPSFRQVVLCMLVWAMPRVADASQPCCRVFVKILMFTWHMMGFAIYAERMEGTIRTFRHHVPCLPFNTDT